MPVKNDTRFNIGKKESEAFIGAYWANGFNAVAACRVLRPDLSEEDVKQCARQFMAQSGLAERLRQKRIHALRVFDASEERIIQEICCLAFFDVADLLTKEGHMRDLSDIPQDARRAITSIDIEEIWAGGKDDRSVVGHTKKIKLGSKEKALELLGRYQKLFVDKIEHSGAIKADPFVKPIDLKKRIAQIVEAQIADALQ